MRRARVLLIITLIVLIYALATGFPVFLRMFYVFGLLLFFSFIWVMVMARGISVTVRRTSLRTTAGQPLVETVSARRRHNFLHGLVEVQEQTDMPVKAPGAVIGLEGFEDVTVNLEVPCPQRGVYKVGPLRLHASDPFGLYRVQRNIGQAQRVVVHPVAAELPNFLLLPADLPGEGPIHIRSQHVTTSAFTLRDYVNGDSLNSISWKATARHGRIMVKEFEMEPSNSIWVVADMEKRANTGPAGRDIEETVVKMAASVCTRYADRGYPVGLLAHGNERFSMAPQRGPDHLLRIMDALAEVRATGNMRLFDLIADLSTKIGRYSSVAIVTPSTDEEWLNSVRHLLQRKTRITAVLVESEREPAPAPPAVAVRIAALGVPSYTIPAGADPGTGLTAVGMTARAHDRFMQPIGAWAS
jgi:uncharacterized protein (DUF58 family)